MTNDNELPLWWIKEDIIEHLRNLGNEDSFANLKDKSIKELLVDLIGYAKNRGYNEAILLLNHTLDEMYRR